MLIDYAVLKKMLLRAVVPEQDSVCTNLEWELGTAHCFGLKAPSLLPTWGSGPV